MGELQTSIWFVRHGPVEQSMLYGQMDVAANLSSENGLNWLAAQLPKKAVWISSDLDRCVRTAEKTSDCAGGQRRLRHRIKALREQHFGHWQGLEYSQIEAAYPELYKKFWRDPVRAAPPGGESFEEVITRVERCLTDLLTRYAGRQIVCFCHAGTIRSGLALIKGMSAEAALNFAVDPLSLSKIDYFDKSDIASSRVDFVNRLGEG